MILKVIIIYDNVQQLNQNYSRELHIDGFIGRSIYECLRQVKEPFCYFADFVSPHNPYDPPKPYDELFINKKLPKRKYVSWKSSKKTKRNL
jgi:hypothetical protein